MAYHVHLIRKNTENKNMAKKRKLSGSDIIVRTLIEQGCDVVFGYPGGQIINVYDSLYKYQSELKHVLTAHEQALRMRLTDTPVQLVKSVLLLQHQARAQQIL